MQMLKKDKQKIKKTRKKKIEKEELLRDNDFSNARLHNWMDTRIIKKYSNKSSISL